MDAVPSLMDIKRHRLETMIWVIDMIGYVAVLGMGIFATFFSPGSVKTFLVGWEWVTVLWCFFLLLGGTVGFIGRATRIGLIEIPANTASLFGVVIYLIVIQGLAMVQPEAYVAAFAMIIVTGAILRRSAELAIFYSDAGGKKGFWDWFTAARTRRTLNTVPRIRD